MFSIYQVLPKMNELWGLNVGTDVESRNDGCPEAYVELAMQEDFDIF